MIAEAFVESIPQTHLTLILLCFNLRPEADDAITDPRDVTDFAIFLVGFISSVISATLGMTRLLMNGPSKVIKKQGHLGGYLQIGFALVFFSIMFVLVAKALWLAFVIAGSGSNPLYALIWLAVSLLPQFILVSNLHTTSIYIKNN